MDWDCPGDPAASGSWPRSRKPLGDLSAAGRRRWEVISSREPTPKGYFDLGRLWVRAGQWDQADAAFNKAEDLGFRPRAPSRWYFLGASSSG